MRPAACCKTSSTTWARTGLGPRRVEAIVPGFGTERLDDEGCLAGLQPLGRLILGRFVHVDGRGVVQRRAGFLRLLECRIVGVDRRSDCSRARTLNDVDRYGAGGRFRNAKPSAIASMVGNP